MQLAQTFLPDGTKVNEAVIETESEYTRLMRNMAELYDDCYTVCTDIDENARNETGATPMTHDEYIKKYPNYCRDCNGTGIHECHDSVPYGSTNISMDTSEPCVCTEQGCPRCNNPAVWNDSIDDFVTCPGCGWDYYSAVDFGCPRKPRKTFITYTDTGNGVYAIDEYHP